MYQHGSATPDTFSRLPACRGVVTFLFIQKLVENVRRRRTSGNQRQNGSRQAVSDFCVHGYLSGFIGFWALDMFISSSLLPQVANRSIQSWGLFMDNNTISLQELLDSISRLREREYPYRRLLISGILNSKETDAINAGINPVWIMQSQMVSGTTRLFQAACCITGWKICW